ncbi:hypothetical protein ACFX2G_025004 [Malus domestica]
MKGRKREVGEKDVMMREEGVVMSSNWLRSGYKTETRAQIDETELIKKHRNREEKEEKKEKQKKGREKENCHQPKSQRLGPAAEKDNKRLFSCEESTSVYFRLSLG